MARYAFTAKELEGFYGVLDSVVCETAERGIRLSVYEMIARLFTAAEQGETNALRLRQAILRTAADDMEELMSARRFGRECGSEKMSPRREAAAA